MNTAQACTYTLHTYIYICRKNYGFSLFTPKQQHKTHLYIYAMSTTPQIYSLEVKLIFGASLATRISLPPKPLGL